MSLFDENTNKILLKFLDKKAAEAEKEIADKGVLSEEYAIPLILKTLFNHVAHLDLEITELRTTLDKRFEQIESKFDKKFEQVNIALTLGFSIIAFLIILFGFLK